MEAKQQTLLTFNGVDIVNVNVRLKNPVPNDSNPLVDSTIVPKVYYPKERVNDFIIIFEVNLTSKDFFNISVLAFGFFQLVNPVPDDEVSKKNFININAPAIMFPYVRSFISTLTGNLGSNFKTLILPPQFFQGDLAEHTDPVQLRADTVDFSTNA